MHLPHFAAQKCKQFKIYHSSYLLSTNITLCGCSSSHSPAFIFPPPSTPADCLSSGPATPLAKRTQTFSQNIGDLKFTCNTDSNQNPYQDCLNAMAYICNPTYVGTNPERISNCKHAVDKISNGLNSQWQAVRKECGQWLYDGFRGDFSSVNCLSANAGLRANSYYVLSDGSSSFVTTQLTESVRLGLWNNQVLKG